METNSQQGCCPLHEKLTGAIFLINSKHKKKKKGKALANNSQNYFILFVGLDFYHLAQ